MIMWKGRSFYFSILLITIPSLYASEEKSMDQSKTSYQKLKGEIVQDNLKARKLQTSLYIIHQRVKEIRSEISKNTDKALIIQNKAEEAAKVTVQYEEKLNSVKDAVSQRIRTMYKLKEPFLLRILFSSTGIHGLHQNIYFLKKLTGRDVKLIRKMKSYFQLLKSSKEHLKDKIKNMMILRNKLQIKEENLDRDQKRKIAILSQLRLARAAKVSEIRGLRHRLKREGVKSNQEMEASFFEKKGQIMHPVSGVVSEPYGVLRDAHYGYYLAHKGYFYEAPQGSLVYGVHPGKVAYLGFVDGYGQTVILDHGDSYYTVYSGYASVKVVEGQKVVKGEILGQVGFSIKHRKMGTYFEIRHFSDAVNPQSWLVREDKKEKI